jgi:hypothetical protein
MYMFVQVSRLERRGIAVSDRSAEGEFLGKIGSI